MQKLPQDHTMHCFLAVHPVILRLDEWQELLYVLYLKGEFENKKINLIKLSQSWSALDKDESFQQERQDQVLLDAIMGLFQAFKSKLEKL